MKIRPTGVPLPMNLRPLHDSLDHAHRSPVMVVDDDRLVLLTLAHGLRHAGFEVLEADNGDDAILMARAHRPGLVLLDIRMQGLSGFDVAQHLKDYERIPFIFVSAFADEDVRQQAQSLGALACLSKPVDMVDLVSLVARVLDVRDSHFKDPAPGGQGAAEASWACAATTHAQPSASLPDPMPVSTEAALALGLLMQREALLRADAWARLHALAQPHGGDIDLCARLLVAAHEDALQGGSAHPAHA